MLTLVILIEYLHFQLPIDIYKLYLSLLMRIKRSTYLYHSISQILNVKCDK